jgi:histidine triad (HIT) family protein
MSGVAGSFDDKCIFCKIIAGQIPSAKVYEDDEVLVFMNLQQKNPGHSLVITKEHYPYLYELPDTLVAKTALVAKQIANAVKKGFACDGINILQNNEPASMQSVFHYHIHVIPRYKGDDLLGIWASPGATPEMLSQNAGILKAVL